MLFEEFLDGRHGDHFGYQNGTILAVLKSHVAPCPPSSFGTIEQDLMFGADVVLDIFKMTAILDSGTEQF